MKLPPPLPLFACIAVQLLFIHDLKAAQPAYDARLPSGTQMDAAYAACGGPPIQNGREIQPTPERLNCLHAHLRGRQIAKKTLNTSPQAQEREAGQPLGMDKGLGN